MSKDSSEDTIIQVLEDELEGNKGDKIDPRDTSPPEGSPRWNEIYGKMKQYERDIAEMKDEKAALVELVEDMKAFNKKLADSIERQTDVMGDLVEKRNDKQDDLDSRISELKSKRKEALEALDYDLAEEINDQLFDLKMEKRDRKVSPKPSKEMERNYQRDADVMLDFIDKVEWYKTDPEMRHYANQLDAAFVSDPVWGKKPVIERLKEIKKRTEKRFGMETTKTSGVESDSTGSPIKGVKLSQEELHLANAFGLTPERWAKQKAIIEGRK